jgi:hypothetical protein
MPGQPPVRFRIAQVLPEHHPLPAGYGYPAGSTFLYVLHYLARDGAWKPFCAPDAQGARTAVLLPGSYDARNTARADPALVTFACTRGVLAKCYRWGYRPWLGERLASAHQACVRMAMADYCGDGRPWTRDGTLIDMWDTLVPPVQRRDGSDRDMLFEAAWTPAGAACLAHRRWTGLPEEFYPQRCERPLPACASPEEARRRFGDALLFNGSHHNRLAGR